MSYNMGEHSRNGKSRVEGAICEPEERPERNRSRRRKYRGASAEVKAQRRKCRHLVRSRNQ